MLQLIKQLLIIIILMLIVLILLIIIIKNHQTVTVPEVNSLIESVHKNDETTESRLPPNAKRIAIAYLFEQLGAPYNTKNEHGRLMASMIALLQPINKIY
jgi:hypothetical protein